MRYELNFDEDKIIDIEAIGDNSVLDLKNCCKLLNELNDENKYLKKRIKAISDELYCKDRKLEELGIPIECCDKDE